MEITGISPRALREVAAFAPYRLETAVVPRALMRSFNPRKGSFAHVGLLLALSVSRCDRRQKPEDLGSGIHL